LAALISVPESMELPADYIKINSIGTLNVLEAAKRCGVKSVVLSSSAANYGDNPIVPKLESMNPEPKSPYAVTKLDGEFYCDMYTREHGLNAVSLRYFNVFGPRQDPSSQYAAAVPIFIDRAVRGEDISIFGDGEQTRDFVFVKDVVQANFLAAEKAQGGLFNVAWGQKITIKDLAGKVIELTGSEAEIRHLPERAGDIKHSMADNSKIVSQLGFKASSNLTDGLKETIKFFQNK
jgi:UDP-glucose 4-epimerase